MQTAQAVENFALRLAAAIEASGMPKRTLARRLAEAKGTSINSERRQIYQWLEGIQPEPANAELLAEILDDPGLAEVEDRATRRRSRDEEIRQLRERLDAVEKLVREVRGLIEEDDPEGA